MHDSRNISVNLHNQFGLTLRNVFDTQVRSVNIIYMYFFLILF